MRITEEEISMLKQLDRIEYRQKREDIKNKNQSSESVSFIWFMLLGLGLIMIIDMWQALHTGIWFSIGTFITFMRFSIIAFVILVVLDIVHVFVHYYRMKMLNEEYFNCEIEVNK